MQRVQCPLRPKLNVSTTSIRTEEEGIEPLTRTHPLIMANVLTRRGSKISTDSDTLALLGKKQVLKRRFGFWSLFAFAVCELITWETVLALFAEGLDNGGPAGLIYGFMIAWFSTLFVEIPSRT